MKEILIRQRERIITRMFLLAGYPPTTDRTPAKFMEAFAKANTDRVRRVEANHILRIFNELTQQLEDLEG